MDAGQSAALIRSVCVFCGSAVGRNAQFVDVARELGAGLARHNLALVYGGARHVLMGVLADAALLHHGRVVGVMPDSLMEREIAHPGLTELHVVPSMHARKARMADLSDAVVMLPGGLGTLDEMFEMWTWSVLGIHTRPMALLNAGGYFGPLLFMLERMVHDGFVRPADAARVQVHERVDALLDSLLAGAEHG